MISEEWRNELLSKINIADVVGEYVTLQNKGGRLWACCPFHHEKTPSFTVNTDRQFYHCFGCGKGGNAINFVMEMDKLSYPEACQVLAEKAGMEMPKTDTRTNYEELKQKRQRIYDMNKIAARFFYDNLFKEEGKAAREYLRKRGLGEGTVKTFGMGFALDKWDGLLNLLEEKGYTKNEINRAGLCRLKDGKCYDMFRNRVMIPIINQYGQVIGFGGRVMGEGEPKYLNTFETLAFNKGKNLYNLNLARKQRNMEYIILAEGYMDVIALYSHGIRNCVATLGTALTPDQARLIGRYSKKVILSYDGDGAGIKAALRGVDILYEQGLEPMVITIPGNMDPDEFLAKYKKEGYLQLIKNAKPRLAYKFNAAAKKYNLKDGYEKEKYAKDCIDILRGEKSPIIKEKYINALSKITGFSVNSLYEELGEKMQKADFEPQPQIRQKESVKNPREDYIVMRLLKNPQDLSKIEAFLTPEDFVDESCKNIFFAIKDGINKGFCRSDAEILSVLSNNDDLSKATALMEMQNVPGLEEISLLSKNNDDFLTDCIRDVKIKALERRRDKLMEERRIEKDESRKQEILQEANKIIGELKEIKRYLMSR